MKDKIKIGIIILNYNTWKESIECVRSIQSHTKNEYHIYLIDNNSMDRSEEKLKTFVSENEFITFAKAERNKGYSAGNNIGIKMAIADGCEIIFIINSDIVLLNDAIDKMSKVLLDNDRVMAVGPSVINNEKEESQSAKKKLTWKTFFWGRKPFCNFPYLKNKGNRSFVTKKKGLFIFSGMVSGCCFCMRSEDIKNFGYLDEHLFLYYEEDILAYKIAEAGKKVAINYEAQVWHKEGISTGKSGTAFVHFHRWTSVLYLLKQYVKINKLQKMYVMLTNIITWIVFSFFSSDYRKYCKAFIQKNINIIWEK